MSKAYLAWVKTLPCAVCGTSHDIDAHHLKGYNLGGASVKGPDLLSIPLCRAHHDAFHRDPNQFETTHGRQADMLVRTLNQAIFQGRVREDV